MHARAMTASDGGGPAWPAAWKLDDGQQMVFRDLVTVDRFSEQWHFKGKCFCGLDFASHNTVATNTSSAGGHAFVCKRCKCFFIKDLRGPDGVLPLIDYNELTTTDISIEDKEFTQFEYLVLRKTLALKIALDKELTGLSKRSAKQNAFTGTVADATVEKTITTTQKWIPTDMDNNLTVLLDHFKTFNRAMTSQSCEAFTIPGKSDNIELTYWYGETIGTNYVNVYSPGSIGLSNVYLISVKYISTYNFTNAFKYVEKFLAFIAVVAAIYFEPAEIEEIGYGDAYENKTTSVNITSSLTITSEAVTAVFYAVFNMKFADSVMLLMDCSRGGQKTRTLLPFNNENINLFVDTAFNGVKALKTVSVTVSGAPDVTKTYAGSIPGIKDAIKGDYNVATLVPGGGAHPYLQIPSDTSQPWTGANMYGTTDASVLKAHIADRVKDLVQKSWHAGGAVLTNDGIVYRADNSNPPALTMFEKSRQVYVKPVFDELAANICINAPNVVSWDKLKSGMSIVTDHTFWADFEARLFTPVPFWEKWAATVGPGPDTLLKLDGDDTLPTDMVYVPAWLALDILLKTQKLKFVPTKSSLPDGATYSVYDIWSLIATPKSDGTFATTIARAMQALTSKAVQAVISTKDVAAFGIKRVNEGFTLLADDLTKVSATLASTDLSKSSTDDISVANMARMVTGIAVTKFIAVPAAAAVATAAAHRYSGSSTFEWTLENVTSAIETKMHGGTFTIDRSLYTEQGATDSGMHYVLSSFMEQIRLLTGKTLNNEIALPKSILTANNQAFKDVILKMLANHKISQVGDDALSFSRTVTGAGLSNIFSYNIFTNSTLFQQTSPGKYINIGTYDRKGSTLTVSNGVVNEVKLPKSKMTQFKPTEIDARRVLGDLYPVEPGTISIIETDLPPFTLPRVSATEIYATADNFNFASISKTVQTAYGTIDTNDKKNLKHPANNKVMTLDAVLDISKLYSDSYSALAYMPDRTIFENNTLASMAYATCIQNAKNAWGSLSQTYAAGIVHTDARMQCYNVWSNANMQMLHSEKDASGQIWPALQYVVDHLVENKDTFGMTTNGAVIDLSTIIYWLDSATPLALNEHFGENAKIWFRFGTTVKSLSLKGRSNSFNWKTTRQATVPAQITALNIYCNARLNGITDSIRQNMDVWGVKLLFQDNQTLYPEPISLKVSPTLVSPYPTVATLPSAVNLYRAFPVIQSSVICCLFYMIRAWVMPGGRQVVIAGKTEFKDMLPRGIQPMLLRHAHAGDNDVPAGWKYTRASDDGFNRNMIQFTQQAA